MSSSGTVRSRRAERGFVLATTLLVTTLLTVMLAASFILVSAEQRMTDNSLGTARALALADAGLQNYFSQSRPIATDSTYDSTRIMLTGGYADVVARRVRPAGAMVGSPLALWVVRSGGVATTGVMAGQAQGRRTIAQLAQFNPGTLPARAAMVTANGVQWQTAGGNPVDGHDANFCSPHKDTTGLTIPAGKSIPATGSQPNGTPGTETIGTTSTNVVDSTHIDWPSLIAGNYTPDYVATPPCLNARQTAGGFPTGLCNGDATLSGYRRGLLVVTGNVTMASGSHWDGILLAGGMLQGATPSASYTIHGMVVTGLNESLGQNVANNQIRRGPGVTIQFASCYTGPSVLSLSSLVPIKNAWADTWSTY